MVILKDTFEYWTLLLVFWETCIFRRLSVKLPVVPEQPFRNYQMHAEFKNRNFNNGLKLLINVWILYITLLHYKNKGLKCYYFYYSKNRLYIILQLEKVHLICRVNLMLSIAYFHSLIFKHWTKTLASPSEVTGVLYSVCLATERKSYRLLVNACFFSKCKP